MISLFSAPKIDKCLLQEYAKIAKTDRKPYYVSLRDGNWVAYDYLDEYRDSAAYYYVSSFGKVTFGLNAQERALDAQEQA